MLVLDRPVIRRTVAVSRQQSWRWSKGKDGLCGHCGQRPLYSVMHCKVCLIAMRVRIAKQREKARAFRRAGENPPEGG